MLNACLADVRGRTNFEEVDYPQYEYMEGLAEKLINANLTEIKRQGLQGKAFGEAIRKFRLELITTEKALLP